VTVTVRLYHVIQKKMGPVCNMFYVSEIYDYLSGCFRIQRQGSYCKSIIGSGWEWCENRNSSRSTGMYILFLLIYLRGSERKCHSKTWKFFELLVMSVVMNTLRIPKGHIYHRTTCWEQQPNKEYYVFIYLQYGWKTRCGVLKSEGADLPFVRALVRRVRWLKVKGNLPVQLNQPWPRANPSRLPGGGITLTDVAGLRVAYGVSRGEQRLWGGVAGRQVEWGRGGGESTVAVPGGGAQGRTGAGAVLPLPPPFSTSRFRLLAVVSPWRVCSGTRSSPEARKEANLMPPQPQLQTVYLQFAAKIN
jgi:hypothetical protein